MYDWEVKIQAPKNIELGCNEYFSLYRDRISGVYAISDGSGEGDPEKDQSNGPYIVDINRPLEVNFDFFDSDRIYYNVPVTDRDGDSLNALASINEVNDIVKECGLKVVAPQALIDLIKFAQPLN